jgi:hypothetical protein
VSKNCGPIADEDRNSMPSLGELIAKGFETSVKETRSDKYSAKESRCDGY